MQDKAANNELIAFLDSVKEGAGRCNESHQALVSQLTQLKTTFQALEAQLESAYEQQASVFAKHASAYEMLASQVQGLPEGGDGLHKRILDLEEEVHHKEKQLAEQHRKIAALEAQVSAGGDEKVQHYIKGLEEHLQKRNETIHTRHRFLINGHDYVPVNNGIQATIKDDFARSAAKAGLISRAAGDDLDDKSPGRSL